MLRRAMSLVCAVVGAIMAVGCSAGAQEDLQASAALVAGGKPGGTLVCNGNRYHNADPYRDAFTQFDLFNNNGEASLTIDRLVVYTHDGNAACQISGPFQVAPHAIFHLNTGLPPLGNCPSWGLGWDPGNGAFSLLIYWSFANPPQGIVNPLAGISFINRTNFGQTGTELRTGFSFKCDPVFVRP